MQRRAPRARGTGLGPGPQTAPRQQATGYTALQRLWLRLEATLGADEVHEPPHPRGDLRHRRRDGRARIEVRRLADAVYQLRDEAQQMGAAARARKRRGGGT